MRRLRKLLGSMALAVIAVEVVLVLTGVVDFASAARFTIVMELCLAVLVIFELVVVVCAVRAARSSGAELPFALDAALAEFFPGPVARYLRQDLMLLRAIAMLLTGRRDVGDDEEPIPYSGPLVAMLTSITIVDGLAALILHRLLPEQVRWVALVLGVIGLVWLFGFVASLICYPHAVSRTRLRLRFGVFQDVIIPLDRVVSVTTTMQDPPSQRAAKLVVYEIVMTVAGQANIVARLDSANADSINPRLASAPITRATFYSNSASTAAALIRSARQPK